MKYIHKKIKTKSEEIKKLYGSGVKLTHICKILNTTQPTVKKVLKTFFDIDYDKEETLKRKIQLERVIKLYDEGKSQLYIEQTLHLARKTIRELLKSSDGIKYRENREQQLIKYKTELDETVFDVLTPEACYWIGLLYADGHICKEGEYAIEVTLHNQDRGHLEKFKNFLKSSREVKDVKGKNTCRFRFNSKKLHLRLQDLGFTHNKTDFLIPDDRLKWSRDFWRGVVDGDGSLSDTRKYDNIKIVHMCGTKETIQGFIDFVAFHVEGIDKKPSIVKPIGKRKSKNFYQTAFYKETPEITRLLYKNSSIYLDRKFEIYKRFNNL